MHGESPRLASRSARPEGRVANIADFVVAQGAAGRPDGPQYSDFVARVEAALRDSKWQQTESVASALGDLAWMSNASWIVQVADGSEQTG